MALEAGTRLGHYEVLSSLGAGGMGEVYRAHDPRLDRTVAIKVLAEEVASDPDSRRRFELEAKTVAALSHPHICPIFDIGTADGVEYLVMEYLDGETLSARLAAGALPLAKALEIAMQIGDALDAAHQAGVVHRDLKPGNIMLTAAGSKLLDFGLAKLVRRTAGEELGVSGTVTLELTRPGTLLGTLQYMSPEQVEGKQADVRSDVFAFGSVLYEMVTGVRAFNGESEASVAAAILYRQHEPMSAHEPLVAEDLGHLVDRCLAKDPAARWQSVHDLVAELRRVVKSGAGSAAALARNDSATAAGAATPRADTRRSWLVVVAVLALSLVLVVLWLATDKSEVPVREVVRTTVTLPADHQLETFEGAAALALSLDGRSLVYVGRSGSETRLYLRQLDQFETAPLPGTEGARHPFFSADGQWIGFFAAGLLQKIAVEGGLPLTICEVEGVGYGAAWGADGTIVLSPGGEAVGLLTVSADRGELQPLDTGDAVMDGREHSWPAFLPGERALLTTLGYGTSDSQIAVFSFARHEWSILGAGGQGRFVPPHYLVYYEARGGLEAVRFDPERLQMQGSPASVLSSVYRAPASGAAYFGVSRNGTLLYLSGGLERQMVSVDRRGKVSALTNERRGFRFPSLSPDGRRAAVVVDPRPSTLWIYDLERGSRFLLAGATVAGAPDERSRLMPQWTADGRRLVFASAGSLYSMPADGSGPAELLLARGEGLSYATSMSSDGRFLAYNQRLPQTDWDIRVLELGDAPASEPFLATPAAEAGGTFSPDGRYLAYEVEVEGRVEIHARPFRRPGPTVPISIEGGHSPRWSPAGGEIFYRSGAALMAVDVDTTGELVAGEPRILFTGTFTDNSYDYDVSSDGRHFVMIVPDPDAAADRLHVVQGWSQELEKRIP